MAVRDTYDTIKQAYYSTVDTSFVVGDSPVSLDVNATLGRNGVDGFIANDGDGDFTINISRDGTNFGQDIRLKKDEIFSLRSLDVDTVKITHVADSSYRVFAV